MIWRFMRWIYPYLSAWVIPTTVNDLFQALITPRRDPTRRGSASQPELRRETRPGSWLSRIQSGKSWLSPHWDLVEIMYFMDFPLYQTISNVYCTHCSTVLYVFVDWLQDRHVEFASFWGQLRLPHLQRVVWKSRPPCQVQNWCPKTMDA